MYSARVRRNARRAVQQAIKTGKLVRGVCEICGVQEVEGHHDNYGRPLDVRWLCRPHHREWHDARGWKRWGVKDEPAPAWIPSEDLLALVRGQVEVRARLRAVETEMREELRALYASGAQKATLATAAGISRPTLDAWLKRPSEPY